MNYNRIKTPYGLHGALQALGGKNKASSEPRWEGDSAAVVEVLGDVAGARPGHSTEPSGIVHVTIHLRSDLGLLIRTLNQPK